MCVLFFTNLPYNCSELELRQWIEARGTQIDSVRIVRDVVSEASPAFGYAALQDCARMSETALLLNGQKMRNQVIAVQVAPTQYPMQASHHFAL
jgi:hypothetical protein